MFVILKNFITYNKYGIVKIKIALGFLNESIISYILFSITIENKRNLDLG